MNNFLKKMSLRLQILKNNIKILFIKIKIVFNVFKMLLIAYKIKWNNLKTRVRRFVYVTYFSVITPLKFAFIFPALVLCAIFLLPIIISNMLGYGDFLVKMVSEETPREEKLAFWKEYYNFLVHLSFILYICIAAYYVLSK